MASQNKPPTNVLELPLHQRAAMALRAAFEGVLEEHERLGLPLSTLRDGRVVHVSVQEMRDAMNSQSDTKR